MGSLIDVNSLLQLTAKVHSSWQERDTPHNLVIVASAFSEDVLGTLAATFSQPDLLNIVPLIIPKSPILNSDKGLLEDLAAFTGARILNPLTAPLHKASLEDLGRPMTFEGYRFRSVILGESDEVLVSERVEELKHQLKSAESQLESSILAERIAKISGGIAKLKISGKLCWRASGKAGPS